MKHLYLCFLNLRAWLVHRRLRKIGFRKMLDEADARTLLQLAKDGFDEERLILDWIKIGLTVIAIVSLWLVMWLRVLEPIPVIVPIPGKSSTAPAIPSHSIPPSVDEPNHFTYIL
ncbi:MAG TPA: hypothetical protein VL981_11125 [Candidatus Methylacidiphilales bacterium]|nr:hypothetical protein [Candidatus Methylacidiphilales bacterium]